MAALDAMSAAHRKILDRLQAAFDEGVRLDEQLRRTEHADEAAVEPLAQALAFAVTLTQSLSIREARARAEVGRAQARLAETRRQELLLRFAEVQLALADDAVALARTLRKHEEEVRSLLWRSGQLNGEAAFLASALSQDPQVLALMTPGWNQASAAGSGPAFLRALADCLEDQPALLEENAAPPPALLAQNPVDDPVDHLLEEPTASPPARLARLDVVRVNARPASGGKR
jgi:hypothetical protein